jgi:5-methylcytosine-specific restriction endonuclease McrA
MDNLPPHWLYDLILKKRLKPLFGNKRWHNRRRAQMKGGKVTFKEWTAIKEQQHFRCYWCREKFPDNKLEMDHVIPISKGGLHETSNVVAACKPCNLNKKAEIWTLA